MEDNSSEAVSVRYSSTCNKKHRWRIQMIDTVTFFPLSITYPQQAEAAVSQHSPGDRRGVQRGDHAADLRAADRGHLPGGWRAAAISNTNTGNTRWGWRTP